MKQLHPTARRALPLFHDVQREKVREKPDNILVRAQAAVLLFNVWLKFAFVQLLDTSILRISGPPSFRTFFFRTDWRLPSCCRCESSRCHPRHSFSRCDLLLQGFCTLEWKPDRARSRSCCLFVYAFVLGKQRTEVYASPSDFVTDIGRYSIRIWNRT